MNRVTIETAKRLKKAGFPQPKIKVGQVWYNELGAPSVIVRNFGDEFSTGETHWGGCSLHDGTLGNDFPESAMLERCFFAPTATEILKELGKGYSITCADGVFYCYEHKEAGITTYRTVREYGHDNPAEACALAWLGVNEKP